MNDRIALLLKARNISPSQFADDMGVQRSGISHILNGRNKPSLEFIQKLIKLYPDVSMNWILFGEGPMMNSFSTDNSGFGKTPSNAVSETRSKPVVMDLFAGQVDDDNSEAADMEEKGHEIAAIPEENQSVTISSDIHRIDSEKNQELKVSVPLHEHAPEPKKHDETLTFEESNKKPVTQNTGNRKIEKVLIFYSDQTFSAYEPESKP